jgi:tRNA(Ile)-lysidine synthase TilS/MesJ
VLPAAEGVRFRPMIEAQRADVIAHCERHGVPYVQDASNDDPRFLRAQLRNDILPRLRQISPAVDLHLASLAADACRAFGPSHSAPLGARARRRVAAELAKGASAVPLTLAGGEQVLVLRKV